MLTSIRPILYYSGRGTISFCSYADTSLNILHMIPLNHLHDDNFIHEFRMAENPYQKFILGFSLICSATVTERLKCCLQRTSLWSSDFKLYSLSKIRMNSMVVLEIVMNTHNPYHLNAKTHDLIISFFLFSEIFQLPRQQYVDKNGRVHPTNNFLFLKGC